MEKDLHKQIGKPYYFSVQYDSLTPPKDIRCVHCCAIGKMVS